LFVEIEAKPKDITEKKMDSVPVQFQVEYIDEIGRKKLRIFDDHIKITNNEEDFKTTYDQRLNAIFNIQSSGIHDYSGKREKSKTQLQELRNDLMEEIKNMKTANVNFADENFVESVQYLEDELEEMKLEEEMAEQAPKSSYFASVGQSRTRLSHIQMQKRLKKKGKYKKNK